MNLGLDTNVNCQKLVGKIKEAGYSFLCRYYNINNPKKSLTFQEAMALSNAGLYIVVVWENGLPTSKGYFSYKRGFDDARHAYDYARRVIGQPGQTPIYFAVDYDASLADIRGPIKLYFNGIVDAFEQADRVYRKQYKIGVYGSGAVCDYLVANNHRVTYSWLSRSTGWRGSRQFTGWNMKQGKQITLSGVRFDTNVTKGNGGGFKIK